MIERAHCSSSVRYTRFPVAKLSQNPPICAIEESR